MRLIVPVSAAAVLVAIVVAIPTAQQQPAGGVHPAPGRCRPHGVRRQLRRVSCARSDRRQRRAGTHWPQLHWCVGWTADQRALPPCDGDDATTGAGIAWRRNDAERAGVHHPAVGRRAGCTGPHDQDGDDGQRGCSGSRKRSAVDGAGRGHRQRTRSRRCCGRTRRNRERRGEELRPRHTGDAEESASGRLAHLPPQLSRLELQPARSDHQQ